MTAAYDAIIIGTGQAGPPLAARLTAAGMKVAIIERKFFGGTCVNTGCIPTKAMVASAYAAHMAYRAWDFGVSIPHPAHVDMGQVKARRDAISAQARLGIETSLKNMPGCTVYQGHAEFEQPHRIRVGETLLQAERIFINVGARAVVPSLPGLDQVKYLTNSSLMDVDFIPPHLVIVGGSFVGLEFAQMFRRFGSQVTVIEMSPNLIHREDEDVSVAVKDILEREGIEVRVNAKCIGVAGRERSVTAGYDCTAGPKRFRALTCCSPSAERPIPMTSAWIGRASPGTNTGTSLWTMSFERMCLRSGHWATATARERSPTRRTTTSRLSRPIS